SLSTRTPSQSKMTSSKRSATPGSAPEALGQEGQPARVAVLDARVGGVEQLEDVLDLELVELAREGGRPEVEPELVAAAGVQVDAAQGAELVGVAGGHADWVQGQPAGPDLVPEPAGGRGGGRGHGAVRLR